MEMPAAEGTDVAENPENLGPIGQAEEIATEGAQEMRAAKRKQILERIAQMVPGMAAPAAAPMGAPAGADLAGGGLGALTMADEEAASCRSRYRCNARTWHKTSNRKHLSSMWF